MNIVISGYYGFDNTGDEAILFAIISNLIQLDTNIEVTVLSNNPKETSKTYGVTAVNRWRINDVVKALKKSDGLISGGGSLLQDATSWKSVPYYIAVMFIAVILRTPFVFYAQGVGPLKTKWSQWLSKLVISKASLVTVRDKQSKRLLQKIGIKKDIHVVPDPVIGLDFPKNKYMLQKRDKYSESVIAVSVRDWKKGNGYQKKMATALDGVIDKGFKVVFIPFHGGEDTRASRDIASMMKGTPVIACDDLKLEEKMAIIDNADLLFGMRLHSLIFAAVMQTPFIALSYDPKIDAVAEQFDQPIIGKVDGHWSADDLERLLLNQYDHLNIVRQKLKLMIENEQEKIRLTAKNTLQAFYSKF
ncbi:polysaccharide pyruvyl transferase CsaB [Tuberibacillus sp. Marseille-P3662]|uniref:polysaccharide pyruvyl transferase CsaB n=1 Tax=Tuberibacillus sp. Marseille-P3662 TaxID=1965358 RepID=UPI000A1CC020|nr:polysaccharide pyruvyl transferase CsaB [Tuberibacillus sp. Marseille-P3662]